MTKEEKKKWQLTLVENGLLGDKSEVAAHCMSRELRHFHTVEQEFAAVEIVESGMISTWLTELQNRSDGRSD